MSDYKMSRICKGTWVVRFLPTNTVMSPPAGFLYTRDKLLQLQKEEAEMQQGFLEGMEEDDTPHSNKHSKMYTYRGL